MSEAFDLDRFDNPPPPPSILYKYLSPERVGNVLESKTVRFTPLMNTNDSFEVRTTFRKLAGPRFISMLESQMDETSTDELVDELIQEKLSELSIPGIDAAAIRAIFTAQTGQNLTTVLRDEMQGIVNNMFVPYLNSPENAENLLEKFGQDMLCFSLSERFDSSPMWAHYAQDNAGFVISLDTSHEWFSGKTGKRKTRLQKVEYFDGMMDEPLENPQAAFISKTTDWQYEREWRLYSKEADISRIISSPNGKIHLVEFPADLVTEIIVGHKADAQTLDRIVAVAKSEYPHAAILRAQPDRRTHTYALGRI